MARESRENQFAAFYHPWERYYYYYKYENDHTARMFLFILHVCDAKSIWDEVLMFEINRVGTSYMFLSSKFISASVI